ncbi:MAG: hypothetical protein H6730_13175 [Deltaproteobacteria bacterium]|nr:hypothetical protein [Deltaproteobacteria bacterium]
MIARALLPALTAAAVAVPSIAWACDPALVFGDIRPRDDPDLDMPRIGVVVLEVPGFSYGPIDAFLRAPGEEAQYVDVLPMGPDHVVLPVSLSPGANLLEIRAEDWNEARLITMFSTGRRDSTPPSTPGGLQVQATWVPMDECEGPRWRLEASFLPSSDGVGVAAYLLMDADASTPTVVGATLHPVDFEPEAVNLTAFTTEGQRRCFQLIAVDYGGNASAPSPTPVCLDLTEGTDAGIPPLADAGFDDAGTAPGQDAGSPAGLALQGRGCGCSASPGASASAPWGALTLLGTILVRRRRR